MKRNLLLTGIILILILLLSFTTSSSKSTLHLPQKDISLIVVDSAEAREKGLSGKESLPENTGMFFVFDKPSQYEFWMKDMKFPIDIIWLDASFKIIHIESNVSPDTYPNTFKPESDSLYVLETDAHFTEKNNLKVGDTLNIDLKK